MLSEQYCVNSVGMNAASHPSIRCVSNERLPSPEGSLFSFVLPKCPGPLISAPQHASMCRKARHPW